MKKDVTPDWNIPPMKGNPAQEESGTPFVVIFSDLDGTLLDHDTYEWTEAKPALDLCKDLAYPIILVSSKTRAEMEPLRREMSISDPFITENGGGIFFPYSAALPPPPEASLNAGKEGLWKLSLGLPYQHLVKMLQEIREELGLNLKGFSDMKADEISRLTGLDPGTSRLAAKREYDEPFVIIDEQPLDRKALINAAKQRGLTITSGGRFCHLQGGNDKGQSMEIIITWYGQTHGRVISIALGDSPNDFPMLGRADYPVLIRSRHNFQSLKDKIPRLKVTREMGPSGWNSALLGILKSNLRR